MGARGAMRLGDPAPFSSSSTTPTPASPVRDRPDREEEQGEQRGRGEREEVAPPAPPVPAVPVRRPHRGAVDELVAVDEGVARAVALGLRQVGVARLDVAVPRRADELGGGARLEVDEEGGRPTDGRDGRAEPPRAPPSRSDVATLSALSLGLEGRSGAGAGGARCEMAPPRLIGPDRDERRRFWAGGTMREVRVATAGEASKPRSLPPPGVVARTEEKT